MLSRHVPKEAPALPDFLGWWTISRRGFAVELKNSQIVKDFKKGQEQLEAGRQHLIYAHRVNNADCILVVPQKWVRPAKRAVPTRVHVKQDGSRWTELIPGQR